MGDKGFKHICVVGLGLIGASFAAAVTQRVEGSEVVGCDTNNRSCQKAAEQGWVIDAFSPEANRFQDVLATSDLVVLATPAHTTIQYLKLLSDYGYNGLVTDTASTKTSICEFVENVLSADFFFIPGHPMAGSEQNGIEGARPGLFDGCHWILCPNERTNAEAFSALHELITSIGARVLSVPWEEHDRAVAIVSHVPHIIASGLVELAVRHADEQESLFRLAAGGFKDSTRIAAGSPDLWCGISFDNRDALMDGLAEMVDITNQFLEALQDNDRQTFKQLLMQSAQARRSLPAKWVPSTDSLLEVRIPMENRSGVIAEVTTIAGRAGCNILSIEIDHLTAHSAVLSMILTDEGDVGKLSGELIKAGFAVSFSPLEARE